MKELDPPYKEKDRECDVCGYKWKLCYNYIKNPNWNPEYKCPKCNDIIPSGEDMNKTVLRELTFLRKYWIEH